MTFQNLYNHYTKHEVDACSYYACTIQGSFNNKMLSSIFSKFLTYVNIYSLLPDATDAVFKRAEISKISFYYLIYYKYF